MKLTQFKTKISDDKRLGLLKGDVIVDVTEIAPDMLSLIKQGSAALFAADKLTPRSAYALDAVEHLPAVDAGKVVAVGRNYFDHAVEGGNEPPKSPLLFTKFTNALAGHNAEIPLHAISGQIDFEAEMAVVIGKRASKVNEADALNYVFGYATGNDFSARDLQLRDGRQGSQFMIGKTPDGFMPIGPYLVGAEIVGDPQKLAIECSVNGEKRQSSNTSDMIFPVAQIIAYASSIFTLKPGDVFSTGTPEGVILGKPEAEQVWLKAGDKVACSVEKCGELRFELSEFKVS